MTERPGRLLELAVADLALIDRLRLPLESGINVLTGETGAGKSLLIDALGLTDGEWPRPRGTRHRVVGPAALASARELLDAAEAWRGRPLVAS